jgi:cleavage and polyadenylation specificity factor subunit 1
VCWLGFIPHGVCFEVLLRSGQMAIYEALASVGPTSPTRGCSLAVKFVKVASQAFDIHKPDESEKSVIAEQRRISHMFIPRS